MTIVAASRKDNHVRLISDSLCMGHGAGGEHVRLSDMNKIERFGPETFAAGIGDADGTDALRFAVEYSGTWPDFGSAALWSTWREALSCMREHSTIPSPGTQKILVVDGADIILLVDDEDVAPRRCDDGKDVLVCYGDEYFRSGPSDAQQLMDWAEDVFREMRGTAEEQLAPAWCLI